MPRTFVGPVGFDLSLTINSRHESRAASEIAQRGSEDDEKLPSLVSLVVRDDLAIASHDEQLQDQPVGRLFHGLDMAIGKNKLNYSNVPTAKIPTLASWVRNQTVDTARGSRRASK